MFDIFKKKTVGFDNLNFTSDCHCHLLPGVDDGVQKDEESIAILKRMASCGVKSVVLTPHINPDIFHNNTEDYIRARFKEFKKSIPPEISIDITLGGEYMVVEGFERRNPSELIQFQKDKVLIEMSYYYISSNMEEAIFNLSLGGLQPVIAHPERYVYLDGHFGVFDRYYDMGATFQLNLLSLGGGYGRSSVRIMEYLMKKGYYTHKGTDTHSLTHFDNITKVQFSNSLLESGAAAIKNI